MINEKPGDVWRNLAAPIASADIAWRQDGKPTQRDGKYVARFVCYIEAGTVRERLDSVIPGEWDLALEALPQVAGAGGEIDPDAACAFKATLTILGVRRECVGTGSDYKSAATDAFKRAAVRFGIGHELYTMGQIWVPVDGDGKYAKPLEDPQQVYERKHGAQGSAPQPVARTASAAPPAQSSESAEPSCPKCGSRMWDNRTTKRSPKAPDYKCRQRSCDGVIWPPKPGDKQITLGAELPGEFDEPEMDDGYLDAIASGH